MGRKNNTMRPPVPIIFALLMFHLPVNAALPPEEIEADLVKWRQANLMYDKERFADYTEADLPTLAGFLTSEYAMGAYYLMVDLNKSECTKYFIDVFLESRAPLTEHISRHLRIESDAQGFPRELVYTLSKQFLEKRGFEYNTILLLGCLGSNEDIPYLRQIENIAIERYGTRDSSDNDYFQTPIRYACARLGDLSAIEATKSKLVAPRADAGRGVWTRFDGEVRALLYIRRNVLLPCLIPSLEYSETPATEYCFTAYTPTHPRDTALQLLMEYVPRELHPVSEGDHAAYIAKWVELLKDSEFIKKEPNK